MGLVLRKNPYRKRGNKYGRKKIEYEGKMFDSKLELSIYKHYQLLQSQNKIKDLETQHTVVLQDGPRDVRITMRVDFTWINVENNTREFGEAKGQPTEAWKLKLKLWKFKHPGRLEIWKGSHLKYFLDEVVE